MLPMNDAMCTRCNGSGKTIFAHVENGTCFACGGTGRVKARKTAAPKGRVVKESQAAVRLRLRELYGAVEQNPRSWIRWPGMNNAASLAARLTEADGKLREAATAAFKKLLGDDWAKVEAEMAKCAA